MTREEAINAITQFIENYAYGNDLIGLKMAIETLKKERPHGEWIKDDWVRDLKGEFHRKYTCSECGYEVIKCYPSNAKYSSFFISSIVDVFIFNVSTSSLVML